jgi:hypothetical protein
MVVHFQLIEETKSWSSFFLSQAKFPSSLMLMKSWASYVEMHEARLLLPDA